MVPASGFVWSVWSVETWCIVWTAELSLVTTGLYASCAEVHVLVVRVHIHMSARYLLLFRPGAFI